MFSRTIFGIILLVVLSFTYLSKCAEDTPTRVVKTKSQESVIESTIKYHLIFLTQPGPTGVINEVIRSAPEVTIYDTSDQVVSQKGIDITLEVYLDNKCTEQADEQMEINQNTITAVEGVATFNDLKYNTAEIIYLKALSPNITSSCSKAINIQNTDGSSASKLIYSEPLSGNEIAGSNFSISPKVLVKNDNDQTVTEGSSSITITAHTNDQCSDGNKAPGTLSNNSGDSQNGELNFSSLYYERAISIYLKVSAEGLTSTCSGPIQINPAAASKLIFSTQPSSSATAGSNFSTQPVVQIMDTFDNPVSSATNNITLSAFTDSNCSSSTSTSINVSTNPLAASSGIATFSGVNYPNAETIYLRASASDLTSACSSSIAISSATANKLVFSTQPSSSATAGSNFSTQPAVQIADTFGNLISNATNNITLASFTDSSCSSSTSTSINVSTNPLAASSGSATFSGVNYTNAETIYLRASASDLTSACSGSITINSAAANKLVFSTQPSSSATAGSNFSTQPVVRIADTFDNLASSATNNITLTAYTDSDCSSSTSTSINASTNPLAASSGIATFSGVNYTNAETIYLEASASNLTSACSSSIAIGPAVASQLVFSTQPSSSSTVDTVLSTQPVVRALDAFDNLATNSQVNVALAASTASDCSSTTAGLSADTNPVTTDNGEASFSGVKHNTAETIRLEASSDDTSSACSNEITVGSAEPFTVSVDSNLDNGSGQTNPTYAHSFNCSSGSNRSPAVSWSGVPADTQEFILIMDDLDGGPWLHWVIQFSSSTSSLAENIANQQNPSTPSGSRQGINDFWSQASSEPQYGWGGPSPPTPNHRYRFTLYALKSGLGSSWTISSRSDLESQLTGISFEKAETTITLSPCP